MMSVVAILRFKIEHVYLRAALEQTVSYACVIITILAKFIASFGQTVVYDCVIISLFT